MSRETMKLRSTHGSQESSSRNSDIRHLEGMREFLTTPNLIIKPKYDIADKSDAARPGTNHLSHRIGTDTRSSFAIAALNTAVGEA